MNTTASQVIDLDAVRAQRDEMQHAMGRVESALAAPDRGRREQWIGAVLRSLVVLEVELEEHVEGTEGLDGFFEQIIEHAPNLVNAVRKMCADHRDLAEGISACRAAVAGLESIPPGRDEDALAAARDSVLRLLGQFSRHRHRGANLAYDAFNVDLSFGD